MSKFTLKKRFSKSAATYDKNASLQKRIEDKLIGKMARAKATPTLVLDIGAGTASGSRKLLETFSGSKIVACDIAHGMMRYAKCENTRDDMPISYVTADMENLPFKDNTFNAIYSSAAVHWLNDQNRLFSRAKALLKDDGMFCFSTFGPDTLKELKRSFDDAYLSSDKERKAHLNYLTPLHEIVLALTRAGFSNITTELEVKKVQYPGANELLRSLKAIGSHKTETAHGFLGKDFFKKVFTVYEDRFSDNGGIYATYVVYYFICRG